MGKLEIFEKVMGIVEDETGVSRERILSNDKSEEVTDARYLLTRQLNRIGLYPSQIASFINKTPRCVNIILEKYGNREQRRKILRIYREHIEHFIGTIKLSMNSL